MPIFKVLPAEDAEICLVAQAAASSPFSPPVLSWQTRPEGSAQAPRASHEFTVGPAPAERALDRMKRQPPQAPPAAKIREIKARVIPRETHGERLARVQGWTSDSQASHWTMPSLTLLFVCFFLVCFVVRWALLRDLDDSVQVAPTPPDVYCRGITRMVDGFAYSFLPSVGNGNGNGSGSSNGPIIPARVVQTLPDHGFDLVGLGLGLGLGLGVPGAGGGPVHAHVHAMHGDVRVVPTKAEHGFDLEALKIAERTKILQQKNRFQHYEAAAIAAAVAAAGAAAAGVATPAAVVAGPSKRKNGSGGSSAGSDGGSHVSDGDSSEPSSLGVGSDISALSLGSGSASSSSSLAAAASAASAASSASSISADSTGSAPKKARVDKKGSAAATTTAAPAGPVVKRRSDRVSENGGEWACTCFVHAQVV